MQIQFPYGFDSHGRTALTDDATHVREMIEQVLFTSPGERVNRPEFGSGLLQLVFAPNSDTLAAALEASVHASLQRDLGDLVTINNLQVQNVDEKLIVNLSYTLIATGMTTTETFERSAVG